MAYLFRHERLANAKKKASLACATASASGTGKFRQFEPGGMGKWDLISNNPARFNQHVCFVLFVSRAGSPNALRNVAFEKHPQGPLHVLVQCCVCFMSPPLPWPLDRTRVSFRSFWRSMCVSFCLIRVVRFLPNEHGGTYSHNSSTSTCSPTD